MLKPNDSSSPSAVCRNFREAAESAGGLPDIGFGPQPAPSKQHIEIEDNIMNRVIVLCSQRHDHSRRREAEPLSASNLLCELPDDVAGKPLVDFPVSWDGLADSCLGILIPVMVAAMSDQSATGRLNAPD